MLSPNSCGKYVPAACYGHEHSRETSEIFRGRTGGQPAILGSGGRAPVAILARRYDCLRLADDAEVQLFGWRIAKGSILLATCPPIRNVSVSMAAAFLETGGDVFRLHELRDAMMLATFTSKSTLLHPAKWCGRV